MSTRAQTFEGIWPRGKTGGKLGEGGPLQTILKTNKYKLLTWFFGRLEAGEYICSRNEHASLDIRHKSAEMSTRAQTFEGIYICSRNEHASSNIRHKSAEMSTRAQTFEGIWPRGKEGGKL